MKSKNIFMIVWSTLVASLQFTSATIYASDDIACAAMFAIRGESDLISFLPKSGIEVKLLTKQNENPILVAYVNPKALSPKHFDDIKINLTEDPNTPLIQVVYKLKSIAKDEIETQDAYSGLGALVALASSGFVTVLHLVDYGSYESLLTSPDTVERIYGSFSYAASVGIPAMMGIFMLRELISLAIDQSKNEERIEKLTTKLTDDELNAMVTTHHNSSNSSKEFPKLLLLYYKKMPDVLSATFESYNQETFEDFSQIIADK